MALKQQKSIWGYNGLLLALVLILFFTYYYNRTLFFHPCSTHQWRQADCLSITKNYYEEGMHFFQPKIHYQGPEGGKAVSELPILNYTVASLWKVFGEHEFIYRLLEYLIFLTGVFILFNTIGLYLRSWLLAFITAGLLLTSPLLTYYSLNFIADVPALSISIISLSLFFRFYHNKKQYLFYIALALGTLSVLMKASSLIPLSLLLLFSFFDFVNLTAVTGTEKLFRSKRAPLIAIVGSASIIFSWYHWALSYNFNNANNIFLLTILPIWEMDEQDIIINLRVLIQDLFPTFLNTPTLVLIFVAAFYLISQFKKLDGFFKWAFVIGFVYFFAYLAAFFQVFSVHDYYLTNLMIFPVLVLMGITNVLVKSEYFRQTKTFYVLVLIFFFIFNAAGSAAKYRIRMIKEDNYVTWTPFVTNEDIKAWEYLNWDYSIAIKKLEDIKPVLRAHGIDRNARVVVVPDQSFNISLYFMDVKGYGISRDHFENDSTVTDHFRWLRMQYFIMSDTLLKRKPAFKRIEPFLTPYFVDKGVAVYRLSPDY